MMAEISFNFSRHANHDYHGLANSLFRSYFRLRPAEGRFTGRMINFFHRNRLSDHRGVLPS